MTILANNALRLTGAMIPTELYSSTLTRHPESHCHADLVIEVRVCWIEPRSLSFTYLLKGDNGRIRVPPPRAPRWADRLWEHSCFEAFVGELGKPEYYEFNFSPSREWATYRFRDYRDGGPIDDDGLEPKIAVRQEAETLAMDAVVRLDRLLTIARERAYGLGFRRSLKTPTAGFPTGRLSIRRANPTSIIQIVSF